MDDFTPARLVFSFSLPCQTQHGPQKQRPPIRDFGLVTRSTTSSTTSPALASKAFVCMTTVRIPRRASRARSCPQTGLQFTHSLLGNWSRNGVDASGNDTISRHGYLVFHLVLIVGIPSSCVSQSFGDMEVVDLRPHRFVHSRHFLLGGLSTPRVSRPALMYPAVRREKSEKCIDAC